MKKTTRFLALFLAVLMVLGIFASAVMAAEIDTEVIDEKWGKPTFAYGAALDEASIEETMKKLGIKNRDNVNFVKVDAKDLKKYLGGDTTDANMISSILVKKENKGHGVEVIIETPENISQVKDVQYANAAITAGVSDAVIMVAAYKPVTGEAALTGVYKAFEANGEALEEDRIEVANEELETVNGIVQEHKDEEGFSSEELNKAIVDIKESLIDLKKKTGELATRDEIEDIINKALKDYDLDKIVSQINIDKLVVFFNNFQNTSAIDSEAILKQLNELGDNLKETIGDYYKQAQDSGFLDKLADFFRSVGQAIMNLFSR